MPNNARRQSRTSRCARLGLGAGVALVLATFALPVPGAVAKPSDSASCMATFYANQSFGNVGQDVRGWATSGAGVVGEFSSTFAKYRDGSYDGCAGHFGE